MTNERPRVEEHGDSAYEQSVYQELRPIMTAEQIERWVVTEIPALGGLKPIDIIHNDDLIAKEQLAAIVSELIWPGMS